MRIISSDGTGRRRRVGAALMAACLSGVSWAAAAWEPQKTLELVVGSSAGSGTDVAARIMQKLFQQNKMINVPAVVVNKPGGGSAIAFAYLAERAGDPHYVVIGSYNLVTNHITGKSSLGISDFTPLGLLFNEYISFNVRADSPIKNARDLLARVKHDPQSIAFGLSSSVAGANNIALALVMKAAGVDIRKLKVVVFNSGGQSATALLGGHVDVQIVSASVASKQLAAGKIRMLAVTSPQRLQRELAQVPTWKEAGIPVVASNWRTVIGTKGLTADQVGYWDQLLGRLVQTKEWAKYLDDSFSDNAYLNSAQTTKYLTDQSAEIRAVLVDLGLAK